MKEQGNGKGIIIRRRSRKEEKAKGMRCIIIITVWCVMRMKIGKEYAGKVSKC